MSALCSRETKRAANTFGQSHAYKGLIVQSHLWFVGQWFLLKWDSDKRDVIFKKLHLAHQPHLEKDHLRHCRCWGTFGPFCLRNLSSGLSWVTTRARLHPLALLYKWLFSRHEIRSPIQWCIGPPADASICEPWMEYWANFSWSTLVGAWFWRWKEECGWWKSSGSSSTRSVALDFSNGHAHHVSHERAWRFSLTLFAFPWTDLWAKFRLNLVHWDLNGFCEPPFGSMTLSLSLALFETFASRSKWRSRLRLLSRCINEHFTWNIVLCLGLKCLCKQKLTINCTSRERICPSVFSLFWLNCVFVFQMTDDLTICYSSLLFSSFFASREALFRRNEQWINILCTWWFSQRVESGITCGQLLKENIFYLKFPFSYFYLGARVL